MKPDEIVAKIEQAFAKVTRGAGVTLHETKVIDAHGSERDRAKARRKDTERRWQNVPDAVIEAHPEALSFLDPAGFRYYLPAYMRWSLLHFKTSDSLSSDYTIYALAPSGNKGVTDWNRERWGWLSQEQANVILEFLRFMAEHGKGRTDAFMARLAIDAFWEQFSQPEGAGDSQ